MDGSNNKDYSPGAGDQKVELFNSSSVSVNPDVHHLQQQQQKNSSGQELEKNKLVGNNGDERLQEEQELADEHENIEEQQLIEREVEDNNVAERVEENDALRRFQELWLEEIFPYAMERRQERPYNSLVQYNTNEEKAKVLYLRGKELESAGKVKEAFKYFKEAVLLCPDGEGRYYHYSEDNSLSSEEQESPEEEPEESPETDKSDDDELNFSDGQMLNRLQRILSRKGRLLEPARPQKEAHISWLPYELVLEILRWVVSSDLDVASLERVSACCRGFYVAARDQDIWKLICASTWRYNCGTPKASGFSSWRDMYIQRPHLRLHGCYINKTSYIRHGENSFQDQFYKPWYNVEYYRYLRFFPEGQVLAWTTAEVPSNAVSLMHHRYVRHNLGILSGYYRLVGDKVIIVVKKQMSERKPAPASNTRFRARIRDAHDYHEQIYQMELELHTVKSHRNFQLTWVEYRMCRRDVWTEMDIIPNKFPPYYFSRVKHYTAESYAPLA